MSVPMLFLCSDGDSSRIIYHHLAKSFGRIPVVMEEPVPRKTMLGVRRRKLGLAAVSSQLAFMAAVRPMVSVFSRQRQSEIISEHSLDRSPLPEAAITHVASANSQQVIDIISAKKPDVILINGTRIISKKVLESTDAIFINTHAGITPKYRGCHGGYWALFNRDQDHCGVTLHQVDAGIDTGQIIEQAFVSPTPRDSFVTYPYLQTAAALPILEQAVNSALRGTLQTKIAEGDSAVWYHPGIFQYVSGLFRGVR